MITLEIGNLYGMESQEQLLQTIKELKEIGMTDEQIQEILERSKEVYGNDEF